MVQDEIADKTLLAESQITEEDEMAMASDDDPFAAEMEEEGEVAAEAEQSIMQKYWYLFLILGIGIVGAVGYLVYMKMMEGGEEEEEEDEEYEGDDDEEDEEFEVEDEEDDIVVEETA